MTSAASVKARLSNYAVSNGKTMQEVLTAYGLERTVYRLSKSGYKDRFTLKGGVFLYALFDGNFVRATSDIDLLARNISNDMADMRKVFEFIFSINCGDALEYDLKSLRIKGITEFKDYHGVNISITAYLDRTRIPVSIDIGFDDVIYPDRVEMDFPVLLDMETPQVYAYSIYSVIAEKFEAIVSLGDANSRYKDFYDIYVLAIRYDLNGNELAEAIKETFKHRETGLEEVYAFEKSFADSNVHQTRWKAFIRKKRALISIELEEVVRILRCLLEPIIGCINNNMDFKGVWNHILQIWEY